MSLPIRWYTVLFIFNILAFGAYAQSFLPAKLVSQQGDTLDGYVRLDYNQHFIRFKRNLTDVPTNRKISSINSLIVRGLVYDRKVVNGENLLMQKLVSGSASLYVIRKRRSFKERFFLEKEANFIELTREVSERSSGGKLYVETNRNDLATFAKYLNDCNDFNRQKWPTGFTEQSFRTLTNDYNTCVDKKNSAAPKNVLYPSSKSLPTRWFINVGAGIVTTFPQNTNSSVAYYRTYLDNVGGGFVHLNDNGSRVVENNYLTGSLGFERFNVGKSISWGGSVSYSQLSYIYSINTRGVITYTPNPVPFVNLDGEIREFPPPMANQPLSFKGESQEKTSVVQANVFVRNNWVLDNSRIYVGMGVGGGLVSSTFLAPVSVYYADGSSQGRSTRDTELSSSSLVKADFLAQAGWLYFIGQRGREVGLSLQYNSLQANRVALLLTYSM